MNIKIQKVVYLSLEYKETVTLRSSILRKPLGLKFSNTDLENEKNQIHFAAFLNGNVIGTFILVPVSKSDIKIRQVCVHENFQQKGIGLKMMYFAEQYAIKNKYKNIYCHSRKNAVNFYKKLAYKVQGNEFIEVGLAHLKLTKKL